MFQGSFLSGVNLIWITLVTQDGNFPPCPAQSHKMGTSHCVQPTEEDKQEMKLSIEANEWAAAKRWERESGSCWHKATDSKRCRWLLVIRLCIEVYGAATHFLYWMPGFTQNEGQEFHCNNELQRWTTETVTWTGIIALISSVVEDIKEAVLAGGTQQWITQQSLAEGCKQWCTC